MSSIIIIVPDARSESDVAATVQRKNAAHAELIAKLRSVAEQASQREIEARRSNGDLAAELRAVRAELTRAQTEAELWEATAATVARHLQPFFKQTKLTAHSVVWATEKVTELLDEARELRLTAEGDMARTALQQPRAGVPAAQSRGRQALMDALSSYYRGESNLTALEQALIMAARAGLIDKGEAVAESVGEWGE